MKKYILFSLTAITLLFSNCNKPDEGGKDNPPTLIITRDEYNLEAEGGSIAVEVSSNVPVTMTIPESAGWITENKTKSVSTSTFHLDVASNETYEARSAEITFGDEESGLSEKVAVNQKGKTFIHVTGVSLDKSELTLIEDETATLVATVAPDDATDKTVTWTTSSAMVATVDNGVVTAKKVGTATITAKAGDKTATCAITVEPFHVIGISLDITDITLNIGDNQKITAIITPDNATDKTVIWASSNSGVATVDGNGLVTALKGGSTIITATTQDGGKTATCSVKVNSDGINVDIGDWGEGGNIGGEAE